MFYSINLPKEAVQDEDTVCRDLWAERALTAYSHFTRQVSGLAQPISSLYSLITHLIVRQEREFVLAIRPNELQFTMGKYFGSRWNAMCPEEMMLYEQLHYAEQHQLATEPMDTTGSSDLE